jgi:hypothetical protein
MVARLFIAWSVEEKIRPGGYSVSGYRDFNPPLVLASPAHAFTKRLVAHSPSSRRPGPGLDRVVSPHQIRTDFAASIS